MSDAPLRTRSAWTSECNQEELLAQVMWATQQKFVTVRTMMNRKGVHWNSWSRVNRVKLGGWLLDCVCDASGWFEKQIIQKRRKKQTHIVPTAAFMDIKDEVMANAAAFSAIAMPMLVPPKDWSQHEPGGYLLNEVMQGHDMVRRGPTCIQGDQPIEFLNKIQKVGYTLNPFIVEVADTLFDRGYKVGKFVPIVEHPLPNKPLILLLMRMHARIIEDVQLKQ